MKNNPVCPYCKATAEKVTGKEIYPHRPDLYPLVFYRCTPCGAHVGCHRGTDKPLGMLANADLRTARICAHEAFDQLWREKLPGKMTRSQAYFWLADKLGLSVEKCHIGMFNEAQCRQVELAVEQRFSNLTNPQE